MLLRKTVVAAFVAFAGLAFAGNALADGQNGTTLSATKTAAGHFTRTFGWTIDKSVAPESHDLFVGDSGTSNYTVSVTKDSGTDAYSVDGQVCVTNGGAVTTENLAVLDQVEYKVGSGKFQNLAGASEQIPVGGELAPGESSCYPYSISLTPVAGASYRNVAHVTITNHSSFLGEPFGPDPKADFTIPSTPTLVNDSVTVDDTNGDSWTFSDSGSVGYDRTFSCETLDSGGTFPNTATIAETGQSDGASVLVQCFGLNVSKTASTSFTRTYGWSIAKAADQTALNLEKGQSFPVNYTVTVDANGYADSDHAVAGTIAVENPAPIDATVNAVSDVVSDDIAASVDCGVEFPYTIAAGDTLNCSYTAALPDAADRTNTATATLQNSPSGTTDFTGSAAVGFADATRTDVNDSVNVTDTLGGSLGTASWGVDTPKVFQYVYTVGPYSEAGDYTVSNTATIVETGQSASWDVNVHIAAGGCTLTIGYWKTHAGFGPQADMVSGLLPITLGSGGGKSVVVTTAAQAVELLSKSGDASNGVNKLYAQLLAAKLNIKAGADATAVAATISAADAFLALKNAADWGALSKQQRAQVNTWATTLDAYNNGLIGPGHCSQ